MKIKLTMAILLSCVLLGACSDDDDEKIDGTVYTLTTDKAPLLFNDYENVEVETFNITSNDSWTITVPDNEWLTIDQTEGTGNATIKVTVQPNTTLSDKELLLTVTGVHNPDNVLKIAVSQASDNTVYTLNVDNESLLFDNHENTDSLIFNITSNESWTITVPDNQWLTVDQTEGTGNATIKLTAIPNETSYDKSIILTITGVKNTANVIKLSVKQTLLFNVLDQIEDANFKRYLQDVTFNVEGVKKTIVTEADAAAVKQFNFSGWSGKDSGQAISSLNGIEYFTGLTSLIIAGASGNGHPIKELDLSKNTELTQFVSQNNKLTTLDLSNNKKLTYIFIAGDPLSSVTGSVLVPEVVYNNTSTTFSPGRGSVPNIYQIVVQ